VLCASMVAVNARCPTAASSLTELAYLVFTSAAACMSRARSDAQQTVRVRWLPMHAAPLLLPFSLNLAWCSFPPLVVTSAAACRCCTGCLAQRTMHVRWNPVHAAPLLLPVTHSLVLTSAAAADAAAACRCMSSLARREPPSLWQLASHSLVFTPAVVAAAAAACRCMSSLARLGSPSTMCLALTGVHPCCCWCCCCCLQMHEFPRKTRLTIHNLPRTLWCSPLLLLLLLLADL
jgi:hypothetical protein